MWINHLIYNSAICYGIMVFSTPHIIIENTYFTDKTARYILKSPHSHAIIVSGETRAHQRRSTRDPPRHGGKDNR